jgi:hypothetical protein
MFEEELARGAAEAIVRLVEIGLETAAKGKAEASRRRRNEL